MAQKQRSPDPIDELSGQVDRLASWVAENRARVIVACLLVLATAATAGLYRSVRERAEREASSELARAEARFREAMGAQAGATEIVEPANPELARRAREESVEALRALAAEHEGTVAAALARLKAGNRLAELVDPEAAMEEWHAARTAAPDGSALKGLVLMRMARAEEEAGRFPEAASAYEEAAGIEAFPLRWVALAEAARSWANAGDPARARSLYARLEEEAPDTPLSDHVRDRLRELEAAGAS